MTALTRMLKVLRLSRAGPLMTRLTSHLTIHSAYIDAGKFFLYVVVVAHVLARLRPGWEKGANVSPLKALRISRVSVAHTQFQKLISLGPR